ncbi:chemotaxis protein CheW [Erythrobacter sanguineus]|jgi:purine-binding chemotaxis protein CheW|uniref:CheW protein n=1 Tax=Erythrobacter sanguineus TaxID=198312 RepID=A0A1M7RWZ3_9SPHN|nr:chemotaxis protein CheW [Erythrobacter sanguineus]MCR9179424.1 chemotaxis protein CheW [Erythrobacteraceae bacterium]SHN50819.1 CheW protein [Erythrobacter sanguineus]
MNQLLVIVQIAGRRCALSAHDVKSVIELGAITPVPRAADFIAGIAALRSQSLTVIDCRRAIGFDAAPWPTDDRAAVIGNGGHSYALMVDGIEDITTATGEPGQVPGGFGPEWSRIAAGMIETATGPALLIDLPALIAGPDTPRGEIEVAA